MGLHFVGLGQAYGRRLDALGSACVRAAISMDRVEKPRLLFALCSRFVRLGGFFMKFRRRNAHPNRPGGLSYCVFLLHTGASSVTSRLTRAALWLRWQISNVNPVGARDLRIVLPSRRCPSREARMSSVTPT